MRKFKKVKPPSKQASSKSTGPSTSSGYSAPVLLDPDPSEVSSDEEHSGTSDNKNDRDAFDGHSDEDD